MLYPGNMLSTMFLMAILAFGSQICNILYICLQRWVKNILPVSRELKDDVGVAVESLVLLLKCLKIMENATFLSTDNQVQVKYEYLFLPKFL